MLVLPRPRSAYPIAGIPIVYTHCLDGLPQFSVLLFLAFGFDLGFALLIGQLGFEKDILELLGRADYPTRFINNGDGLSNGGGHFLT